MKIKKTLEEKLEMLEDELNPRLMFSSIRSTLLFKIVEGRIDVKELTKKELANRGIGKGGFWIGFDGAQKEWGIK